MPKLYTFRRKINIPTYPIHANMWKKGGQFSIHGNVVNVPANVNSVVKTLPRSINESKTIPIKSKSKLEVRSTIISFTNC